MLYTTMGSRDTLHRLVDELAEEDIPTAERVLQALGETAASHVPLDTAPLDDEPDDDDFDGGLTEARADAESGRVVPHEEVKAAIRRAQAVVRSYVPERKKLSDELIAERREESRRG
jgi:predicted transcriptional regulator